MRIYHQYYRQQNPGKRRAVLRGDKKEIHGALMGALESPGKRSNPKASGFGRGIDMFNFLGQLKKEISQAAKDAGNRKLTKKERSAARRKVQVYIPIRDTIQARIEGYLDEDALNYSLTEALRDLGKAEVRAIREMIDDLGGEASPQEGKAIRRGLRHRPEVRRAQDRVDAFEKADEAFRKSIARGQLSDTAWMVGPERLAAMKAQQGDARAELGDERYYPADEKLWKLVQNALEVKYPERYIPARVASVRKTEFALLVEMNHSGTSKAKKATIKKRLDAAIANRWRTHALKSYEEAGGKELSRKEIKLREAQRLKKLGTPFPLGPGFYGIITNVNKAEKEAAGTNTCKWHLIDQDGFVYMTGFDGSKSSASRNVAIAYRVVVNLAKLGDEAGWDNLEDRDRRWLDDRRPDLSKRIARMLLQHVNVRRKITKSTAQWIVSAADIEKYQAKEEESVAQTCKNMTIGEERIFPGPKGKYHIHVRKMSGGRYAFHVETSDGRSSHPRRKKGCEDVVRDGHVIGGAMTGAQEVAKAITNPGKMKRLENSARKYFRQANPKLPRQSADEGDIRELTGMVGVPDDPEAAYRYGFYAGIIRGIDTCGVQNYFKRGRIRKEFQQRLMSAAMETTARATGTRSGSFGKGRRKKSASASTEAEFDSILAGLNDLGD